MHCQRKAGAESHGHPASVLLNIGLSEEHCLYTFTYQLFFFFFPPYKYGLFRRLHKNC